MAAYLKKIESALTPVYVCLNDALVSQVAEKAKSIGLNQLKVILPAQLGTYLQKDPRGAEHFYIVDEYYHILRKTPFNLDATNLIPGIFEVGINHDLVLMTGHYSSQFSEFLPRHFPSLTMDFCYDEMPVFKKESNLNEVQVICDDNVNRLSAKLKAQIEEELSQRPVIVFGKTTDQAFIDSITLPEGIQKLVVTTDDHVKKARKFYQMQRRGLIFMSDDYSIGVDVKCGDSATVLIFVEDEGKKPDQEQLM